MNSFLSPSRRLISLVVAGLLAMPFAAPLPVGADVPPTPLLVDAFGRTVTQGWGTADLGGTYGHDGNPGAFAVDGAVGRMTLSKAGANRLAFATATLARDTDARVRVQIDRLPVGGGLWVYGPARRNGTSEYRPKLVINATGNVSVHAGAAVNNVESSIGPLTPVPGLTAAPGAWIWLRSTVTGVSPTTVNVKAWADGTTEPAGWQFSATNSAAALQVPGGVGLRGYASSITNAPIVLAFDDLLVESLDPPPAPVADFSSAQVPETLMVDFTDASSGGPTEWAWDFGDGETSIEQNPSHSYATDATYQVSLTVTNAGGSDIVTRDVVVEPLPPPPPTSVVEVADAFERTRSGSWGVADQGGLYSYQGRLSDFGVDGTGGTLLLPTAGASRGAFLLSSQMGDADMSFTVSTDKLAAGAAIYVYGTLRRATDGSAYRPKLRFATNGAVFAHAGRVGSNGSESSLGPDVRVDGLTHAAGAIIHFRAQAVGADPTTIRVRAWADGQPEPEVWHFTATDSTPKLQAPGAVGLISHVASGSTAGAVVIRFDDLVVATTAPVDRVEGETFVGAGDIAVCGSSGDEATANLLDMIAGTVFTAGDNAYPNASAQDFSNCYEPSWGRHKARTYPAVGNHEYITASDAGPYFDYFGAAAGERGKGWYAYDVGTWRIYVLNSNCSIVVCTAGSEQEVWLRTDLAANPRTCSVAIWHHPRYSSATDHGSTPSVQPLWQALFDAGVEMGISGHDHDYERFAPLDAGGAIDEANGIRQFVVGTGGTGLRPGFGTPLTGSEVRQATSHGLLNLVLGDGEYEWEFIPIAGQLFTDRGSGTCH